VTTDEQGLIKLALDGTQDIQQFGLKNGQFLYTTLKEAIVPTSTLNYKFVKQHPIDEFLIKQQGTIKRPRNPQ
jgi:hypothetical protein